MSKNQLLCLCKRLWNRFLNGSNDLEYFPSNDNGTNSPSYSLASTNNNDICLIQDVYIGNHDHEYDLIVIGGGSGGLSAAKEAARWGMKVALCDYVVPSPQGSVWGLGGTCVNVGCVPKKLMHQASLIGERCQDASHFGWDSHSEKSHERIDWHKLVENIQNYISSLNWGYRVALREKRIKYLNAYACFKDKNTISAIAKNGSEKLLTSQYFIIATGGRPTYPDIPGAKEFGISSDDIFSLPYNPGKTLFIGAGYISLECAGFCRGIGNEVTVMVRSVLLRDFDQQMAGLIGSHMETMGIKFLRDCVPLSLEQITEGHPGKIKVKGRYGDGSLYEDWFNSVVFAIGRTAETSKLNLHAIGVEVNEKNGKILHNEQEQSTVPNIYAIGDVLDGKPELTPVAIQAGVNLARRLGNIGTTLTDYVNIPTTVYTPIEYGCVGYSEEGAKEVYGEEDIEVYHKNMWPLEWTVPKRPENACYAKLICVRSLEEKVVGLHYFGPNAGEVVQGYAGMVVMGAKKSDFDRLLGIHPTTAEVFTTMDITKASGISPDAKGC